MTSPIIRYPMESLATLGTNAEGSDYNATVSNVTIANDATYGDVAYFSGDRTSRIDLDTIPTSVFLGNAPRSVSLWLTFDQINGNKNVFSQGDSMGRGRFAQVKIGFRNDQVRVEFGGFSNTNNDETLEADTWYHFVWTYDGSSSQTYWNGSLSESRNIALNWNGTSLP